MLKKYIKGAINITSIPILTAILILGIYNTTINPKKYITIILILTVSTGFAQSFDGIDVSHHQGKINWSKVQKSCPNLKFVYVKATEGKTYVDPRYEENVKGARKAGFKVSRVEYIQRYTLMNHLYWILKNKPAGHKVWQRFDCSFLNRIYFVFLKLFKMTDTIIIELEK